MQFDIGRELEKINVEFEFIDNQVKLCCPFHDDTTASAVVYLDDNSFKCFACDTTSPGEAMLSRLRNESIDDTVKYLREKYGLTTEKTINAKKIQDFQRAFRNATKLQQQLLDRGVGEQEWFDYEIGMDKKGRITIPIKNKQGQYVNIRYYRPGAESSKKMQNERGCGRNRLYPVDQLRYDTIVLCGGEMKAIAAASILNQQSIGAVTTTGGESSWEIDFTREFTAKKVYVCMDIDVAGKKAAQKHCMTLSHVTDELYHIDLPLDIEKYPNGDINDFIVSEGNLLELLRVAPKYEYKAKTDLEDVEPKLINFSEIGKASLAGERVKFKGIVSAIQETPFLIPKLVDIDCPMGGFDECNLCPVAQHQKTLYDVHPECENILEFVNSNRNQVEQVIGNLIGIPKPCRAWNPIRLEHYEAEQVRISQELDITNKVTQRDNQPAIMLKKEGDGEVTTNEAAFFVGRTWPHPKSQEATTIISSYEMTQDVLSSYKCTDPDKLKLFQPEEWSIESLDERLDTIYTDLEANVTKIFQRRNLHVCVDLTYHSPLFVEFDGEKKNGWVQSLIVGDTRQGKSQVTETLVEHYALGEIVECKNTSFAGVVGGLQKFGDGEWYVTWGTVPINDRRIVILEELKDKSNEILSKMTHIRSSGIAKLTKIKTLQTHARTRLCVLSNPIGDRKVDTYNLGMDVIIELIQQPEDISRFDMFLVVEKSEIKDLSKLIRQKKQVEHIHTPNLCHELVLWCWTRDKVILEDETHLLDEADVFTDKYVDSVPIVDYGSMRFKLLRLAAALAGRTYSTDDGRALVVRRCHVEWVSKYLQRVYDSEIFGYGDYSERVRARETLNEEDQLKQTLYTQPFAKSLVNALLYEDKVDVMHVAHNAGVPKGEADLLISQMVRANALERTRTQNVYTKTSAFTRLLKEASKNGITNGSQFE